MKIKFLFIIFFFIFLFGVKAQVSIKLRAPQQAEVGQRIQISYVANTQDVEDIQVGDFTNFNVLYGPSTSSSSSYSIINGKSSHTSSLTFTYVIVPTTEGLQKIPAATIIVDGKSYKSSSATIEILPSSNNSINSSSQNRQNRQRQSTSQGSQNVEKSSEISGKELYMTVTANKKKIYEQEAILLTYKLYTLVNIQQIAGEMPQLDGFHVQEVENKAQMTLKYERVNGRNYGTAVWRQYVLFPQKSGKLKVPSITFDSQVEIQNTSMDPFDIFFGGGSLSQIVKKSIVAPAIEIDVLPLPSPKPDNFSGAVGKFTISGSLIPEQLNANDAATLRLTVNGQGNMKLIKAPKVFFPHDFEAYDPKVNDKTTKTSLGAKGSVIFDYVAVPRLGGKYTIAPVEFCYFDPETSKYITLLTDSFSIAVAKSKGGKVDNYHEQEDLKVINNDIRFINLSSASTIDRLNTFWGSTSYWLIYIILFVTFIIVCFSLNRRVNDVTSISLRRGKKAGKEASLRLKKANKLMNNHQSDLFYDEVMRALLGYVADKLNFSTTELNKESVCTAMASKGVDVELIKEYIDVLSDCEYARFAPGNADETMDKLFSRSLSVINKIDSAII